MKEKIKNLQASIFFIKDTLRIKTTLSEVETKKLLERLKNESDELFSIKEVIRIKQLKETKV